MKKILFGLIVCALLVGMTGVVSANGNDTYCKVTGGGTVVDIDGNDIGFTVSFTAQGTCGVGPGDENYDVKGKVTIVYHPKKGKSNLVKLDVLKISWCEEKDDFFSTGLSLEDGKFLYVNDFGEGAKASSHRDHVDCIDYWGAGYLSGNAQVKISEAT